MSSTTTGATPPATRRIAQSYLTDLICAIEVLDVDASKAHRLVAPVVEQLLGHADVQHRLRRDQLVLTFDLADDPTTWATAAKLENRDYPGQPGERTPDL